MSYLVAAASLNNAATPHITSNILAANKMSPPDVMKVLVVLSMLVPITAVITASASEIARSAQVKRLILEAIILS